MKRPLAYITAPWSNSQYENAENAAAYCRQVYDAGYSPICPVLFLPTFLKDEIPQEHKDGLDMARDYLRRSHVLVVCGHGIDETVKNDIATAERLRITATTLDTRHMIIFDVLTNDSPVGWKGERTRLFLSDTGYEKALDSQEKGQIKILSHAKVRQGNLHYDRSDQLR